MPGGIAAPSEKWPLGGEGGIVTALQLLGRARRPAPSAANGERPLGAGSEPSDRALQVLLVAAVLALVIVLWQLAVTAGRIPPFLVPAPLRVARALLNAYRNGVLAPAIGVTLYETVAGFLLGSGLAIAIGFLIAYSRLCKLGLYPYVVAFQSIPKVAIAPLIVVWFGFGLTSKIVTAALVALFPVLVNTIAGLEAADAGHLELMRAVCASRWQTFLWVRWPASLPYLFAGLEAGLIFSLIGAIVAEFVGSKSGLGTYILNLQFNMDTAGVFAGLIVLSVTGVVLHALLRLIGRRLIFWTHSDGAAGA